MPLAMGRICSCNGWDDIGRDMDADGTPKFQQYCYDCKLPLKEFNYIAYDTVRESLKHRLGKDPKDITLEEMKKEIPLFKDNRDGNGECEYKGCISNETQYHHYGFKRVFGIEEANKFHRGPLCKKHHKYLHDKVEDYWRVYFKEELKPYFEEYFSLQAIGRRTMLNLQDSLSPKVGG